jgi:sporulation protein YlmC with PRC-barrel domain
MTSGAMRGPRRRRSDKADGRPPGSRSAVRFASELLGRPVLDADGRRLGRIVDLEVLPREGFAVRSIVVGRSTFLARFTLALGRDGPKTLIPEKNVVFPWSRVRLEDGHCVLEPSERRRAGPAGR